MENENTPKKLGLNIKENLLTKPNKKVLFTGFLNNVDAKEFLKYCIKYSTLTTDEYNELITEINKRINDVKKDEITKLESKIKSMQKKLNSLKN